MRFLTENPQTLLLVNPAKPKRAARKSDDPATKAARNALKATKAELEKTKAQLKEAKKMARKAKKAKKAKAKSKAMGYRSAIRNPAPGKVKKVVKRARVSTPMAASLKEEREQLKLAQQRIKEEAKLLKEIKAQRQAAFGKTKGPTKADQSWDKYVPTLGASRAEVQSKYATLKDARAAYTQAQRRATLAEKDAAKAEKFADVALMLGITPMAAVKKFGTIKAAKAYAKSSRVAAVGTLANKIIKEFGLTGTAAKTVQGMTRSELEDFLVRQRRQPRELIKAGKKGRTAGRKRRGLPKGTKIESLKGYPPSPPDFPSRPPKFPEMAQLVIPSNWRDPIKGRRDSGVYWTPPREGGYSFYPNPSKGKRGKKSKKGAPKAKKSFLSKLPLVGGMFKPSKTAKKGRKNPEFSLGEVAKITLAGGAGYVGGGIVSSVSDTALGAVGLTGLVGRLIGSAGSIVLAHLLFKNSTYYVPVIAGVGVRAAKNLIGGGSGVSVGGSVELEKPASDGGGLLGKVSGMFTGKGMGDASDDELLSSIDASLDEYVDVPMNEYVDVPMNEYVEVPLNEYVDVPMNGYEELADSWLPADPTLGAEYIDTDMSGFEELAGMSSSEQAAYALADEYTTAIPGLDNGELTDEEMEGYEELAGDFDDEEDGLADAFEALADDYEEAEDLGAVPRGAGAARSAAMRRRAQAVRRGGLSSKQRKQMLNRIQGARAKLAAQLDNATAAKVRSDTQAAILTATQENKATTGSKAHFRASFLAFQRRFGSGASNPAVAKAFLVAYRAETKGAKAAAQAAVNAGVPAAVAQAVSQPVPVSVQLESRGVPSSVMTLPDGGLARRISTVQQRYGKIRKAGTGARDFGGIFSKSIFGDRGRWKR